MKKLIKNSILISGLVFMLYSCSINKYIPDGERLYTGATIEIDADSAVPQVPQLKENLRQVLRPEPNSKFLGIHLGLYYYYKKSKRENKFYKQMVI